MKAGPQAERFGAFLMEKLRDPALDYANRLLVGHFKAPSLQSLQASLSQFSEEQRAIIRRCVILSVDGGLHDFLFAISEEHDAESGIAVIVDGKNVAAQSDGLHGEPYGDEGWFARFSKHGLHHEPA